MSARPATTAMGSVAWAFAAWSAVSWTIAGQAGDGCRQVAHAAAGDVLLIQVVFLEVDVPGVRPASVSTAGVSDAIAFTSA